MRWQGFSNFKFYVSASVALIGLSAASTLLTDQVTLAQQSDKVATTTGDNEVEKLESVEKILQETLGNDHPKLKEVRARLDAARAKFEKAAAKQAESAHTRRIQAKLFQSETGPVTVTKIVGEDGDVITENVSGQQAIVVGADGASQVFQNQLANLPREVRGMLLSNPKQNAELKKAVEKLKDKEASEQDKTAAKEKIISILSEQFDEDMTERSKQIAELEKKLATLKEQIEKRKDAKKRMIDLRVEMLLNESEGLGFPSSWQQSGGLSTLSPIETRTIRGVNLAAPAIAPVPPAPPAPPKP